MIPELTLSDGIHPNQNGIGVIVGNIGPLAPVRGTAQANAAEVRVVLELPAPVQVFLQGVGGVGVPGPAIALGSGRLRLEAGGGENAPAKDRHGGVEPAKAGRKAVLSDFDGAQAHR